MSEVGKKHPKPADDIALQDHNSQSIQFMIECLPAIRKLIKDWSAKKILKVVDVGTATGAGANLLATLYKGKFFGIQMKVDALETKNNRFEPYLKLHFPDINYIVSNLFELNKNLLWDLVICSHTVEHMIDPFPFIEELQRRSKHWVLIYCPFNEQPLIEGHEIVFTKDIIDSLQPCYVLCIYSNA